MTPYQWKFVHGRVLAWHRRFETAAVSVREASRQGVTMPVLHLKRSTPVVHEALSACDSVLDDF